MSRHQISNGAEVIEEEWVTFPGGELEGRRPKVMCPSCRERLRARRSEEREGGAAPPPLCFECYRVDQARERALKAARNLFTASEERFQTTLPFEPVNRARLERLQAERAAVRASMQVGHARFTDKRRRAQIAARHALQRIAAGLDTRGADSHERDRVMTRAIHAAELQLPDAWLPFVVSRS